MNPMDSVDVGGIKRADRIESERAARARAVVENAIRHAGGLVSVPEAATLCSVTPAAVEEWVAAGDALVLEQLGRERIPRAQFVENGADGARPHSALGPIVRSLRSQGRGGGVILLWLTSPGVVIGAPGKTPLELLLAQPTTPRFTIIDSTLEWLAVLHDDGAPPATAS